MMHASSLFLIPLFILGIALRLRRNIGRQRIRPRRLRFRIGVLLLALAVFGLAPPLQPELVAALAGGMLAGLAAAAFALRHTRFEFGSFEFGRSESGLKGQYYYPNPYIGLAVSALFIGRMVYRFMVLAPVLQAAQDASTPQWAMLYGARTPLTLASFGLVVGYYAAYYAGVLKRLRAAAADALAASAPAAPGPIETPEAGT